MVCFDCGALSTVFLCDVISERKRMLITAGVLALDFACATLRLDRGETGTLESNAPR